jgi:TetR/AcrR family transcriptional regulator, regulator of mycofactocin system
MATGLRERKKEKTRVALEGAALRLFDERGYDATTVEQIAELADVSTRTFFRYFPTKADVLLSDQAARLAMIRDLLDARPDDEPVAESLRTLMRAIGRDLPTERHLLAAQFRYFADSDDLVAAMRNHHAEIVGLVADFVAARLPTPDPVRVRSLAIATAWVATLVDIAAQWLVAEEGTTPDVEAAIAGFESAIQVPNR